MYFIIKKQMKQTKISDTTTEALFKQQKAIKAITYLRAGTLYVLFGLIIYLTIRDGFNALTIIPIALLPILLLNFNNLKEIKKELKSRE